jgi:heptosyltransferase I
MKERGKKQNKLIDKYAGIPILMLLYLFKLRRPKPDTVKNIGILITPAIGDTIVLQALLYDLAQLGINITVFAPKSTIPVVKIIGYYNAIEEINFFNPLFTIKQIRKYKFDAFIDSAQWSRLSAIYAFFSDAKFTVGFNTPAQFKHLVFDECVNHSDKVHEIYNLKNLNVFGKQTLFVPEINIPAEETSEKRAVLHIKPGGYLSFLKELPTEYWIKIIEKLLKYGYSIYFTGSESDSPAIEDLISSAAGNNKLLNLAGKKSLEETAALLKSAELVISVNTGIMHLASACGCNLIALHGPTNALRWGPFNKNNVSVNSKYSCAPCLNLGFEYKCNDRTGECMKAIDINDIFEAIDYFDSMKKKDLPDDRK